MSYDNEQLRRIIEGALMAAGEALTVDRLHALFEEYEAPEKSTIKELLQAIAEDCSGRGFQLVEVASGWRFQVREEVATWVNRLWDEKPQKYSRALLETLALIAYRQPITRGDIEDVRGVAVSSQIIKTLVEREWVKIIGHRDVPGRPSLYGTTRQFLDYFNLKSLDELPTLSELKDIDSLNGTLDLDDLGGRSDDEAGETPDNDNADGSDQQSVPEQTDAPAVPDGSEVYDPDELREVESITGDSVIVDDEDEQEVPVQAANIPFELDEEASRPKDDSIPDATPTVEQEEYQSRLEREDQLAQDDSQSNNDSALNEEQDNEQDHQHPSDKPSDDEDR